MVTPDFSFELSLLPPSTRYLLGIDEVGRGPWAGPVTVGAFLLDLSVFNPDDFTNLGVRDSKQVTPRCRQRIFDHFHASGFVFNTFSADAAAIDRQGIAPAIKSLVSQALAAFDFDFALLDGNLSNDKISLVKGRNPELVEGRGISLPQADARCFSVAAASIVAKVTRDQLMEGFDRQYPGYGFASHKGYGTAAHLSAIKKLGICPIHRHTYAPIKKFISA